MRTGTKALLLLALLLAAPAAASARGTVIVPVRGILNGDAAERIEEQIMQAIGNGADTILLEIDVLGAPASGPFFHHTENIISRYKQMERSKVPQPTLTISDLRNQVM